jgi:zinc transport system ATP-binding protein
MRLLPSSCGECCTRLHDFGVKLRGDTVLEDINLHMHCGELTALVGPNGAGKTTLLRAMIGEIPYTGTLRFIHKGQVENSTPIRIGYVPQKLDIDRTSPITVLDLFAVAISRWPLWLGTRRAVREEAYRKLAMVGAEQLLKRRISEISVGQLQRIMLALALTPVPELLLLDEPVAALDQGGMELFYQTVSKMRQEFDLSILLVSHDLPVAAQFADRMILLNRKVLCDGPPGEVMLNPLIRQTFGFGYTEEDIAGRRVTLTSLQHEQCVLPVEVKR